MDVSLFPKQSWWSKSMVNMRMPSSIIWTWGIPPTRNFHGKITVCFFMGKWWKMIIIHLGFRAPYFHTNPESIMWLFLFTVPICQFIRLRLFSLKMFTTFLFTGSLWKLGVSNIHGLSLLFLLCAILRQTQIYGSLLFWNPYPNDILEINTIYKVRGYITMLLCFLCNNFFDCLNTKKKVGGFSISISRRPRWSRWGVQLFGCFPPDLWWIPHGRSSWQINCCLVLWNITDGKITIFVHG
jgi:hypothetical protein